MKIDYKVEGKPVERSVFKSLVNNLNIFKVWEQVIEESKSEIESYSVAIVFKIVDKKLIVLTENSLLFKLSYKVKNHLQNNKQKLVYST
jgi:hypothetical protein